MSGDLDRSAVGAAIGHEFRDPDLLSLALTHTSYAAEHPGEEPYERLEFLGDAVLQLAVTRYLFDRFPDAPEGEMAKIRAAVVSAPVLAALARRFGLPVVVRLGRGEELTGGREKDSILSDIMESLIGAVYLEIGFEAVADLVLTHWRPLIEERATVPGGRDYKTRLQEELARRNLIPEYTVADFGPEHAKEFQATVSAGGATLGSGSGSSKKRAERAAAEEALSRLARDGNA